MTASKSLVNGPDGRPLAVQFVAGLPGFDDGPCIFLLDDYSMCEGSINRNSDSRPSGSLVCANPNTGSELFEIALSRVIGWTYAGPRRN